MKTFNEWISNHRTVAISDISPDTYYEEKGAISFIFAKGGLIWSDHTSTHTNVIIQNKDSKIFDQYRSLLNSDNAFNNAYKIRLTLEEWALVGRVSPDRDFVAFWNKPNQLHGLLSDCINELYKNNFILPEAQIVLYGADDAIPASDVISGGTAQPVDTKLDKKRERELELRKQLHVGAPDQRKAARKELGLGFGSHKSKWQSEAEKTGLVRPGQKWWAPTSEDIKTTGNGYQI